MDEPLHPFASIPLGFAPWLRAGEPLDGYLDVVASLYGLKRTELLAHFSAAWGIAGVPPTVEIAATEVGCRLISELQRHVRDHDVARCSAYEQLLPTQRGAYCPLCFAEALHRGELPCFHASWLNCWRTHCARHLTPLFEWPWTERHTGHRHIQRWMTDGYWNPRFAHVSLRPGRDDVVRGDYFGVQLAFARDVRRLMHALDPRALIWNRVVEAERSLLAPGNDRAGFVWWKDGRSVRAGVMGDLVNYLIATFEQDWSNPPFSSLMTHLGPGWMFRRPPTRDIASEAARQSLRGISDPAQRRTVILLIARIVDSFVGDFSCESLQGLPMSAGATALTIALRRDASAARQKWITRQAVRWPYLIRQGFLEAVAPFDTISPAYGRPRKRLRIAQGKS